MRTNPNRVKRERKDCLTHSTQQSCETYNSSHYNEQWALLASAERRYSTRWCQVASSPLAEPSLKESFTSNENATQKLHSHWWHKRLVLVRLISHDVKICTISSIFVYINLLILQKFSTAYRFGLSNEWTVPLNTDWRHYVWDSVI